MDKKKPVNSIDEANKTKSSKEVSKKALYRLIGQVLDEKKKVIGYAVMQEQSGGIKLLGKDEALMIVKQQGAKNATIGKNNELVGIEGSLTRLPVYSTDGKLVAYPRVTVLSVIPTKTGKRDYNIMDAYGRRRRCTPDEALALIQANECTNAKLVNRDGKLVISAIMGEFETVEQSDAGQNKATVKKEKVAVSKEKMEKWERPLNEARYLGNSRPSNAMRIYKASCKCNVIKRNLNSIDAQEAIRYTLVRDINVGLGQILLKTIKTFAAGKYGQRTKKHYPATYKLMTKSDNARAIALKLWDIKKKLQPSTMRIKIGEIRANQVNVLDILSKEELKLYITFADALCTDCLSYERLNMTKSNVNELSKILCTNAKSLAYIESKVGKSEKSIQSTIASAIKEACSGRVDTESQAMFISALEIVNLTKSGIDRYAATSKTGKIITEVASHSNSNPVLIDDKYDSGAMLFQALVLAMTGK